MGGFGDLFGGLGELLGGAVEAVGATEAVKGLIEGTDGRDRSWTQTYDRTLAGAPRELNVNDR